MGYLNRLIIQIRNKENPFIQKDEKRIISREIFSEEGRFLNREKLEKFLKDFFGTEDVTLDDIKRKIESLLNEMLDIINLQIKIKEAIEKTNKLKKEIEGKSLDLNPEQRQKLLKTLEEALEFANKLISEKMRKFLSAFVEKITSRIDKFLTASSFKHFSDLLSRKLDFDPLGENDKKFFKDLEEYIRKKIEEIEKLIPNLTNDETFKKINILIENLSELKQILER